MLVGRHQHAVGCDQATCGVGVDVFAIDGHWRAVAPNGGGEASYVVRLAVESCNGFRGEALAVFGQGALPVLGACRFELTACASDAKDRRSETQNRCAGSGAGGGMGRGLQGKSRALVTYLGALFVELSRRRAPPQAHPVHVRAEGGGAGDAQGGAENEPPRDKE